MTIDTKIWYDLVNAKHGDDYLVLYLARQKTIRKWFKILTIIFSASGIFSASIAAQIPTIISCSLIAAVQLATSIENFIIHSQDDIDDLSKLRLLYYERTNKLEKLWHNWWTDKISDDQASQEFFNLRDLSKKIEELDNKLNVRNFKKLRTVADKTTRNYLNTYYNERRQTTGATSTTQSES